MAAKGKAKTGGRRQGTPNKATAEIKALAQVYGPEVIEKLVKLMRGQDEAIDKLAAKIDKLPDDDDEMRGITRQLLALLTGRNVQNELGAANALADRGFGKAPQHISANVTHSWETVAKAEFDGWLTGLFEPAVTEDERDRPN